MEVCVFRRVREDARTSVQRILAAEGIGIPLVWRTVHELSLYLCHIQQVQALTPPDHHAGVMFCKWILTKCFVNT
jgi:hypothetical protein